MKLPRDVSGEDLAKALRKAGLPHHAAGPGGHIRLTTERMGEHHVTIPNHGASKVNKLAALLDGVGRHHVTGREESIRLLFHRK